MSPLRPLQGFVTTDRAKAYRLVLRLMEALGPAGLSATEQAAIRDAADALLFCTADAPDAEARDALDRLWELLEESRFSEETVDGILDAVEACGPVPLRV
jgi:hypothetical protein